MVHKSLQVPILHLDQNSTMAVNKHNQKITELYEKVLQ